MHEEKECGFQYFTFFRALRFAAEDKKRMTRAKAAVGNLVRCAMHVCKSKSAAIHFETQVALVSVMGADVGDGARRTLRFRPTMTSPTSSTGCRTRTLNNSECSLPRAS